MNKINVLIAEDQVLMREALAFVLNSEGRFQVTASALGEEAVLAAAAMTFDVILLDIGLPGVYGMDVMSILKQFTGNSKVLIISNHSQTEYVRRMMRTGIMGYVTRDSTLDEISEAIVSVHTGQKYICAAIRNKLADEWVDNGGQPSGIGALTPREKEITRYIQQGLSSKEIASALDIRPKTVELHRYRILKKLKVKNSLSLVRFINTNAGELEF